MFDASVWLRLVVVGCGCSSTSKIAVVQNPEESYPTVHHAGNKEQQQRYCDVFHVGIPWLPERFGAYLNIGCHHFTSVNCAVFPCKAHLFSCPSNCCSIVRESCTLSSVIVMIALRPSPSALLRDGPGRRRTRAGV